MRNRMKKAALLCMCAAVLLSSVDVGWLFSASAEGVKQEKIYSSATMEHDFADNRIILVLDNKASINYLQTHTVELGEINYKNYRSLSREEGQQIKTMLDEKSDMSEIERIFSIDSDAEAISKYQEVLCIELEEHSKENVLNAIALLKQREDVLYVGPDYVITGYSEALENSVQNTYLNQTDKIKLNEAWAMAAGSNNTDAVIVGVLDTGIDASHPDLQKRVNSSLSFNFATDDPRDPLTDPYGHGTHVAGIIGAAAQWNVELVSLRIVNSVGKGHISALYEAIEYVTETLTKRENNPVFIPILNFSGGYEVSNPDEAEFLHSKMEKYFEMGGLFVCGAGNKLIKVRDVSDSEDTGTIYYPASYDFGYSDNMIVVGASNMADNGLWIDASDTGSNYGRKAVDIFAPGDTILSCYPTSLCGESSCSTYHESLGYHYNSGTSMATPYVTGVAALILSVHPDLTASEVKNLILDNVTDVIHEDTGMYVFHGLCTSGGRLNAYWALYASHSFGDWQQDVILGCQYRECAECGYKDIEEHSFENTYVNDCVFSECTECGYYREEHTQDYVYVQNDTLTHNRLYPCCNHTIAESHRGAWVDLDATYHTRICTDCGYTQYQTHEECWNDFKNMCMACKRTGPISGSIMRIPPQEETVE